MTTKLGEFFKKHSINKSEVARKIGVNKQRLTQLSTNENSQLKASELYLIALATGTNPCELLEYLFDGTELPEKILNDK
ncbi:Cro/C1-type HTH DNA-binding domain-containing protein [Belliella buryatensis]|uniref:Cro/C1-type HTH DNA-binding domain-containing protein n=1 Tax=Belliella buryatensis TaxID=1500549 RepID=A0A239GZG3_9BACT|nr:helix-turn-helix transcriptional regulator [Belliella buryatensis]SNS74255.1 Cro/C1-type HTH DNA-binding domain-containing protein [Belliella buryatensis]